LALAAALSVGIASGQEPPPPDVTVPAVQSVSADPSVLWPPNHKMRTVTVSAVVTDDTDPAPTWAITGVTSNEPEAGPGADKSPDCVITGPNTVQLRAERLGNGSGRIYTITITASDASGNTATATVEVTVPHDKGKKK
jgi:hypothetical protein